jgi:hypothetical protein
MKKSLFGFILILLGSTSTGWAQEHLGLRLGQEGILSILKLAIDQNIKKLEEGTLKVPSKLYDITIKKEQILKNPVISIINDISDINLKKDLKFYVYNSDLSVKSRLNRKSLKLNILKINEQKFEFSIEGQLNLVELNADEIVVCEKKKGKKCGDGLNVSFSQPSIKLDQNSSPIKLTAVFVINLSGNELKVSFKELKNNLISKPGPVIVPDIAKILLPPMFLTINGQRTEIQIDRKKLKEQLLAKEIKQFLSQKTLEFAAEYAAKDLVVILNKYLKEVILSTGFDVFNYQNEQYYNELFAKPYLAVRDNTYVAPSAQEVYFRSLSERQEEAQNVFDMMMSDLSKIIRSAKFSLHLKNFKTDTKNVDLSFLTNFMINEIGFYPGTTIGNSSTPLAAIHYPVANDHLQMAISEPLLNSFLDAASRLNIIEKAIDQVVGDPSFSVKGARVHFTEAGTINVIALSEFDLSEVTTEYDDNESVLSNIGKYFETQLGKILQKVSDCASVRVLPYGSVVELPKGCRKPIFKFPLQLEVRPWLEQNENNETVLAFKVENPFKDEMNFKNQYGYPSNFNLLVDKVQKGVISGFKEKLSEVIGQTYRVPLNEYLEHDSVKFKLKRVAVLKKSHLVIGADIDKVDLNELRKK